MCPHRSHDYCSQNFLLLAIMSLPVSSAHLWSSSFFPTETKTPLIKREEAEHKKGRKKKINASILVEDKKLLGFNYSPLVAL